jgi:hypothetical protein
MTTTTEKIQDINSCKTSIRMKRFIKKYAHKLRRQSERKNVEEAITKNRYKGWTI